MKKHAIGAVMAACLLGGCATSGEGQGATDAFVSREMAKHGVVSTQPVSSAAPRTVTDVPVS